MRDVSAEQLEPLNRTQRLFAGVLLLLLVDVIWVGSSELTEYIFDDLHYDKPFFSTYVKTTLFTTYLCGFAIYAPWRDECRRQRDNGRNSNNGQYHRVQAEDDDEDVVNLAEETESQESQDESNNSSRGRLLRSLSSPSFVPANIPESGKSSGTEESDVDGIRGASAASGRRVRFQRLAEVVEMNPTEAMAANLARLSYNASLRAQAALRRAAQRLPLSAVAKLALIFCAPWFIGNFSYQMALSKTEAAVVNVLSSTSCFITLLLSALFPSDSSDKLTVSKVCGVGFSICGVVLVSYSDLHIEGDGTVPKGALWALSGAFFYSVYIVLLRRKVSHEENMDVPMFFGFVGLFNAVLLWPGFFICHFTNSEPFELPTVKQWEFLILNGLVGTVVSELLWLWGCFYTSSLIATLAIGLTIPMSVIADMVWRKRSYEPVFMFGVIPMFFSFFVITMLTHYEDWDPCLDFLISTKRTFCTCWQKFVNFICCCCKRHRTNSYVFDRQERELLITQENTASQDVHA